MCLYASGIPCVYKNGLIFFMLEAFKCHYNTQNTGGASENRIARREQRQRIPDQTWNRFVCRKDSFDAVDRQFFHQAHQRPPPKTAAMRLNQKTVNCQQNRKDAAAQISNSKNISNFH